MYQWAVVDGVSLSKTNVTEVVPLGRGLDANNTMARRDSLVITTAGIIVLRPDATDAPWS